MTTDQYIGEQVHMLQWRNHVLRASVNAASIAHALPVQRQGCAGPTVNLIEGV